MCIRDSGSIQHSALEYKEDGDILIDAKKAGATFTTKNSKDNVWDKYEVVDAAKLANYVYVEFLNPEVVMPVGGDKITVTVPNADVYKRQGLYFQPDHLYTTYRSVVNFLCTCILASAKRKVNRAPYKTITDLIE